MTECSSLVTFQILSTSLFLCDEHSHFLLRRLDLQEQKLHKLLFPVQHELQVAELWWLNADHKAPLLFATYHINDMLSFPHVSVMYVHRVGIRRDEQLPSLWRQDGQPSGGAVIPRLLCLRRDLEKDWVLNEWEKDWRHSCTQCGASGGLSRVYPNRDGPRRHTCTHFNDREDVRIWAQELSIPQSGFLLCFPLAGGQKQVPFSEATSGVV